MAASERKCSISSAENSIIINLAKFSTFLYSTDIDTVIGQPWEIKFNFEKFLYEDGVDFLTYQAGRRIVYILSIFAGLIIFFAWMGLFGLAIFTAKQRNKEIGIRKVLGADISTFVAMLS